ncbi:MAG TPA: endonuclease VIII [Streptomyces sp.]|nr:endonuclease VIII [Streptomyces sp.]
MPELPEVEALTVFLGGRLAGRRIERVQPVAVSVLKTYDPPFTALEGRTVTAVTRHGKFLDVEADGLRLVVHLARAGRLHWRRTLPDTPPRPGKGPLALRVRLAPADGAADTGAGFDLTEAGTHKRLAVYCVRDPAEVPGIARLGPDPLDEAFTAEVFAGLLCGERRRIKGVLRDQSVIAGIGNAYSDEILHAARMSPYQLAANLGEERTAGLYAALRETLGGAVERARALGEGAEGAEGKLEAGRLAAEKRSGMRVHGRSGQPCPVCGDTVREVSFADSSLQYCPTCQTGGKPLADRRMSRLLK